MSAQRQIVAGDYVSIVHTMSFIREFADQREYGVVSQIDEDSCYVVFPIGNKDPRQHSQCAPFRESELRLETQEEALKHLPAVWASIDPSELVEGEIN